MISLIRHLRKEQMKASVDKDYIPQRLSYSGFSETLANQIPWMVVRALAFIQ